MAEIFCVVLSVVVHFIFRLAVFVDFTSDDSNLMHLPSLMVLLSVCMMLVDNEVFPARYKRKKWMEVYLMMETIICLFIVEVLMLMVWSRMEILIELLVMATLKNVYGNWTNCATNVTIHSLAMVILTYSTTVTCNMCKIEIALQKAKKKIQEFMKNRKQQQPSQQHKPGCACSSTSPIFLACLRPSAPVVNPEQNRSAANQSGDGSRCSGQNSSVAKQGVRTRSRN